MFHIGGGWLYQATSWIIGPYWTIQYRDGSALASQVLGPQFGNYAIFEVSANRTHQ